ncbi:hypothetical protein PP707_02350 [Acetobacter pasteurianus]|nr:hypothetical protein [Acetobacter pasteurianus]
MSVRGDCTIGKQQQQQQNRNEKKKKRKKENKQNITASSSFSSSYCTIATPHPKREIESVCLLII